MGNVGIIVGVTVGVVALLVFVSLVIFGCVRCHRKNRDKMFAREARILGIRNAVALDHLDEAQQRAMVVRQLNRTLPPDVNLAEAVYAAEQSRNVSFAGPPPAATVNAIHAPGSGPVSTSGTPTTTGPASAGHSTTTPHLQGAARFRQPHILELEMLLPEPYQIPTLPTTPINTSVTAVPVAQEDAPHDGRDPDQPPFAAQPPSRRPSQLSRLVSRFTGGGGGACDGDGHNENHGAASSASGAGESSSAPSPPHPEAMPYSPTLAEPQQKLWNLYLKKKAVEGELVAESTPPDTPLFYRAEAAPYAPRLDQPPIPVHARSHTDSTEPITPVEPVTPTAFVVSFGASKPS